MNTDIRIVNVCSTEHRTLQIVKTTQLQYVHSYHAILTAAQNSYT